MKQPKYRVGQRVGVISGSSSLGDLIEGAYGHVLTVQPPSEFMSQYVYDVALMGRIAEKPPLSPGLMALGSVPMWESELVAVD